MKRLSGVFALLMLVGLAHADRFHVRPDGMDSDARDGRSIKSAWKSLAYACDRVPSGDHSIHLAPGDYLATRTAHPKDGVTIVGRKPYGKDRTRILASKSWKLSDTPRDARESEYLIAFTKAKHIRIHNLALACDPEHRINGAIRVFRSEGITLEALHIQEFRWAGLHVENCKKVSIQKCVLHNASTDRSKYWSGSIRTRYPKESEIAHNRITSSFKGGYGYKGGGHTKVRFHHNLIDVKSEFSFESAHENEFGVEMDHNHFTGCISIPKSGKSADPNTRGFKYTFWIHHNYLTDSYTIEGPRNHLRVERNWIHVEKSNGRFYTHHGGINKGPIWIHHNIIENVDRAVVWMNRGLAENIHVTNNTIFCADAGKRSGAILSAYTADRLNNWTFKNNIVVAAWSQPRKLVQEKRGVPTKMTISNNLCVNVTGVPEGNIVNQAPGLTREGVKPWSFYTPRKKSIVAERGIGAVALDSMLKWDTIPSLKK